MKRILISLSLIFLISLTANSQLAVYKMVGKNSANAKLGFGAFAFTQIPLNDIGNRNFVIELMDLAYFPQKDDNLNTVLAYISIKLGYKYIFSEETNTGFYLEPSAGYCRVVNNDSPDATFGDGFAAALESGYILGVGQQDNTINFGLKYESDMAGTIHKVNTISFRVSYSFHLLRKRRE